MCDGHLPPIAADGELVAALRSGSASVRSPSSAATAGGSRARGLRRVIGCSSSTTWVSTGGSTIHALEAVRETGAEVVAVIPVVDRGADAAATFAELGVHYRPLVSAAQLGIPPLGSESTSTVSLVGAAVERT